jgi:hypothetical protein
LNPSFYCSEVSTETCSSIPKSFLYDVDQSEMNEWIQIKVVDDTFQIGRKSDNLIVFIIPGIFVVECFLNAIEQCDKRNCNFDILVVQKAYEMIRDLTVKRMTKFIRLSDDNNHQVLFIFENLLHSNSAHGPLGKLSSRLNNEVLLFIIYFYLF